MFNSSLNQLSVLLATKQVSSVELTRDFLGNIKNLNKEYNAFITVNEEMQ
jgi:aspartyl-tRNA(Asn)/glutamyl-tRNA(Gln) amidotransferase subunit A